jgi:hypothetical protein
MQAVWIASVRRTAVAWRGVVVGRDGGFDVALAEKPIVAIGMDRQPFGLFGRGTWEVSLG